MPRQQVLTNAQAFGFTPDGGAQLDLAGALVSWNDAIEMRIAKHEYLKRTGGEQENMGASPGRFQMRCTFTGPDWSQRYRDLVNAIRREPRGLMVHPILGQMRVACRGIPQAAVDIPRQLDTIDFTLSFEEDALDASFTAENQQTPAAQQQAVTDTSAALTAAVAKYGSTAVSAAASLTSSAATYAAAAVSSGNTNTSDVTLQQQLNAVGQYASSAIAAVRSDPASSSDAASYAIVTLVEQVYANCQSVDAAVAARRPALQPYTVPGPVSLAALAAQLYGSREAAARRDEIRTNNRLANEYAIPAGTVLMLAPPRS